MAAIVAGEGVLVVLDGGVGSAMTSVELERMVVVDSRERKGD